MAGCSRPAEEYLERGKELGAAGNSAEAILNYRKAIQAKDTLGEAHYRLGIALREEKKLSEALEAFAGAVRVAPHIVEAKVELANLNLQAYQADPRRPKRLYDEVKKLSADLLAKDEKSVAGLRLQGELALLDGSPALALPAFRKANDLQPGHPEAAHGLMRALIGTNQYAEAEKLGLAFIAKDKAFGLIYDDLYALFLLTKRHQEAEQVFRTKVANNPTSPVYRLQLAAHYINNKQQTEMEAALQPLISDPKTFPEGRLEVGQFYARLSMWEKAQAVYEDVVKTDPANKLKARKLLIQTALAQNKAAEAIQTADEAVKEFPEDTEARFLRASLWADSKDPAKHKAAIGDLEQLREKQAKVPTYWYVLAKVQQRTGDNQKAEASYRESVRVDRGFIDGLVALTELLLAKGQAKAALEFAVQASVVAGDDPKVRLLRGRALLESGESGQARSELASLASQYPGAVPVQLQYGLALLTERQFDQAEAIFKRFYRPGQGTLQALDGLARVYGARGQGQRAFELVEAELKRNPQSKELRRLMGQVAVAQGKAGVAAEQYAELTRMEPHVALHRYQLAQALRMNGDIPGAIASLEKVEMMEPENPVPLSVLAFLLQQAGRNDEALGRLRKLIQLRPDDSNVQNNLAFFLADTGQSLDEALTLAQKAMQKASANPDYMDTLGLVYLKQRKTDSAVQTFRAATQKSPENPTFLHHLGLALIDQGNKAEARVVLENALKKNPGAAQAVQIREALKRAA